MPSPAPWPVQLDIVLCRLKQRLLEVPGAILLADQPRMFSVQFDVPHNLAEKPIVMDVAMYETRQVCNLSRHAPRVTEPYCAMITLVDDRGTTRPPTLMGLYPETPEKLGRYLAAGLATQLRRYVNGLTGVGRVSAKLAGLFGTQPVVAPVSTGPLRGAMSGKTAHLA